MFDERTDGKIRLLAADLLSGVVELSRYTGGLPGPLLGHAEDPSAVLDRLVASVEPSDLPGGAQGLWARVKALHAKGRPITWQALLVGASAESQAFASFTENCGMAVAYAAPGAALCLMTVSDAATRFTAAQDEATAALGQIRSAVAHVA